MAFGPLEAVIKRLTDGGVTTSEILIAKKRGAQLLEQIGPKANLDWFILSCLKTEYGITVPALEEYLEVRKLKDMRWWGEGIGRGKKIEREGD